jgi:predicted regulator of Ras-like GTPase activity (Roadblock/LC7/MglB family)
MENILKDMNDLPGVRGSFICDGDGTVISTAMPHAYSSQIGHVGREVVQVIALLQMLGEETDVVDFLFSDGRILVNGFKDFSLIVFCEPDTDIAMVRLESNVTLGEIRRDGRFKRHMQKVSKSRRDLVGGKGLAESYQQIIKKLKSSGR